MQEVNRVRGAMGLWWCWLALGLLALMAMRWFYLLCVVGFDLLLRGGAGGRVDIARISVRRGL